MREVYNYQGDQAGPRISPDDPNAIKLAMSLWPSKGRARVDSEPSTHTHRLALGIPGVISEAPRGVQLDVDGTRLAMNVAIAHILSGRYPFRRHAGDLMVCFAEVPVDAWVEQRVRNMCVRQWGRHGRMSDTARR